MNCARKNKRKKIVRHVPGDANRFMQHPHNYPLVILIFAIVAVQTKDLNNIIENLVNNSVNTTINDTISGTIHTNELTRTTTEQPPTTTPTSPTPSSQNVPNNNIVEDANSTIINIKTVPFSSEIPSSPIHITFINDDDNYFNQTTFDDIETEVPFIIRRPAGSLPTPIVPKRTLTIKRIPSLSKDNRPGHGRRTAVRAALRLAAIEGLQAMNELYDRKEPSLLRRGIFLPKDHPGAKLSAFGAPTDEPNDSERGAYAALYVAKKMRNVLKWNKLSRQAPPKISLRRTPLEQFCPAQVPPRCPTFAVRYRTHDGTCNNARKPRWGAAHMPFHRYLAPAYNDGVEEIRRSVVGGPLPSARFISLLVHGSRESDSPVTLMLAQFGQFIDHDVTLTAQPRPVNGSVIQCCGIRSFDLHPSCAPIKVPIDDPWLSPIGVRCLEFMRSAPAQRPDCLLSWREQTNQVTSFLDGSQIYGSSPSTAEDTRIFNNGLLLFGRGPPRQDACMHGAMANQCIRAGDGRSGEQPGLLAMHHIWVLEHNQIALELAKMNPHWSEEKLYQEARRIVGAMIQHITYREFLPLVLGRDVCQLFDLELLSSGFYTKYDVKTNPTVANAFSAAAFRFGHALIQGSYMRSTSNHQFIDNNVTLHDELAIGDIGGSGSLHRLLRGLAIQRAQKRDEFITAELTNHLFQQSSFRFGNDLAAVNIQRGRDHGVPAYTQWREPCGLTPIRDWSDFEKIVGPSSTRRIQEGYSHVDDVDLFVGGLAERPVIGGLVGPVFACIIAQQFSNLRKGDRFWYENEGFESSFTPAQLQSIRQVLLSQVICQTLGDGTLQPHVFLPHDIASNERLPCGTGSLTPIDLKPWMERDPFFKQLEKPETTTVRNDDRKDSETLPDIPVKQIVNRVDFPISSLLVEMKPINSNQKVPEPFVVNATIVNNKLDLNMNVNHGTRPHVNRNKVVTKTGQRVKNQKQPRPQLTVTTKRSVRKRKTTTRRSTNGQKTGTTNGNKKKNKRPNHVQKRDLTGKEKSRGAILVDLDKKQTISPFNKGHGIDDRNQFLILTPEQSDYEIEINIRPNKRNPKPSTQRPIYDKYTTSSPQEFYNVQHSSHSSNAYGGGSHDQVQSPSYHISDEEPSYNGIITKRPHFTNNRYSVNEHDEIVTTKKPYYNYDYTTKRPLQSNYYFNDETIITTRRPSYNRPATSVQLDTGGYGGGSTFTQSHSDQGGYRPSHDTLSKPQYTTAYGTENDDTYKPYHTQRPPHRPNNDDINYQYRPPLQTQNSHTYGNRPDHDEIITSKPSTAFSYNTQNDHHTERPPILYLNDDWDRTTTQRPQIVTYYSVMTTRKRRRTARPTRPVNSYQQQPPQHDNEDDDDQDDDEDYFTTTKRPYIQHDPIDDWNGNPYAPASYAQHSSNFEYSRQKDVYVFDEQKARTPTSTIDANVSRNDNEPTTYRTKYSFDYDSTNNTDSDLYWYLKPSHTKYHRQKNMTFFDFDSYGSKIKPTNLTNTQTMDLTSKLRHDTNLTLTEPHELTELNDSITDVHRQLDDTTTLNGANDREPKAKQPILMVPLKVLTKPERPDNWVMYHAMEKVPLPNLPQLSMHNGSISNEMPRPITLRPEKKKKT